MTRQPWAQWRCPGDNDVLRCNYLCRIDDAHPPVVVVGVVIALSLFLLLPSLLSWLPFGVIVATVAAVVAAVLVNPATIALATFVVALSMLP